MRGLRVGADDEAAGCAAVGLAKRYGALPRRFGKVKMAHPLRIRFPGHSIRTLAVFSGGVIGGLFYPGLFGAGVVLSRHCTRALRDVRDDSPGAGLTVSAEGGMGGAPAASRTQGRFFVISSRRITLGKRRLGVMA